jgi:hypothetical protein
MKPNLALPVLLAMLLCGCATGHGPSSNYSNPYGYTAPPPPYQGYNRAIDTVVATDRQMAAEVVKARRDLEASLRQLDAATNDFQRAALQVEIENRQQFLQLTISNYEQIHGDGMRLLQSVGNAIQREQTQQELNSIGSSLKGIELELQGQNLTRPAGSTPGADTDPLGVVNANRFDPNSLANPYGAGSPYKPDGLMNPYSQYGSPYSSKSWRNPYATDTPKLIDADGNYRGKLSTNPYDPDSISNPYGRYGSQFSPESVNNPFGAGNPFNTTPIYVVPPR